MEEEMRRQGEAREISREGEDKFMTYECRATRYEFRWFFVRVMITHLAVKLKKHSSLCLY